MTFDKNGDILSVYKSIYNLPELEHQEDVTEEFFELCKTDHYFVIVAIYNKEKEFLLLRDLNKSIGWELPGGYVKKEEDLIESVNRIVLNETGLDIDELTPVSLVKNIFKYKDQKIIHYGIAFMALSRGEVKLLPDNIKFHFTNDNKAVMAYQNSKIINLVKERLLEKSSCPPFEEIDSIKKKHFPLVYWLHNYIVKPIGNSSSVKIHRKIFDLIEGKPKKILDVSCGDSDLVTRLSKKYNADLCIGNDISWKTISFKKGGSEVIFTNHDVVELPYKISFDLIIFKNTLHHIPKDKQQIVIDNLKSMTKQLIVIDINNPQKHSFLSKLWNSYYVYLLGDQGDDFLNKSDFTELVKGVTTDHIKERVTIGHISTIKGEYLCASIVH